MAVKIPSQMQIFLEDMLQEAGLSFQDQESKEVALQDIYAKLDEFLAVVIEEKLPDEKLVEYFKLIQSNKNADQIEAFLQTTIPNYTDTIAKAMLEFREVYLSSVS